MTSTVVLLASLAAYALPAAAPSGGTPTMPAPVAASPDRTRAAQVEPSSPPAVTAHEPLTPGRALEAALAHHPSVGAAQAQRDEARAAHRQSLAAYFPALRLAGSATRFEEPMVVSPIHGFTPGLVPTFDRTLLQGSLSLGWTLFDGGTREGRVGVARAQSQASEAGLEQSRQALVARVVAAYLETLTQRQTLEAHDARLASLASELGRVRQLHAVGRAADAETLRAAAVQATAMAERERTAAALEGAERDLADLMGVAAGVVAGRPLAAVTLADTALGTLDAWLEDAARANPALERARRQRRAAEAGVRAAGGARWPELRAAASIVDYGDADGSVATEWNGGIQLAWPLFTGGATAQDVARARALRRTATEQERLTLLQVRQEVNRAFAAAREARARVASLVLAADRYDELVRIERLSLGTGSATQSDYLNAEADLLAARASLIAARHGAIVARVELGRAIGQLTPDWLARGVEVLP